MAYFSQIFLMERSGLFEKPQAVYCRKKAAEAKFGA
jgi:hypothetical protein